MAATRTLKLTLLGSIAGPEDGGGTPTGRTALEIYGQCRTCRDCLDVVLWVKPGPDGVRLARLEPRTNVEARHGMLYHTHHGCGGVIRAIRPPYPIRLEGSIKD